MLTGMGAHGVWGRRLRRLGLTAVLAIAAAAASATSANAIMIGNVTVTRKLLPSFAAPGTPAEVKIHAAGGGKLHLDDVGILKVIPANMAARRRAKNVLVLEPGTSAAAAYFLPFAKSLVESTPGWQVWAVERRENFLENQKEAYKYKGHKVSEEEFFKYYLGWLTTADTSKHYEFVPPDEVRFAKQWGMNVAVEDLKVVINAAKALGGKVVLGGHSLGGSVVTAYATWDFEGKAGAEGLAGLVFDDGGSSPLAMSKEEAETKLAELEKNCTTMEEDHHECSEGTWLAFGGIPAPLLGLLSMTGSALTAIDPKTTSLLEKWPDLPAELRGPISPVTNEAGFGFSVNVGTSPESLAAAQIHGGTGVSEETEEDGLHGWNGAGALTPVPRYAEMLSGEVSGTALKESGSEWYFPARLTLDTGAVGNGLANPAQEVLGLHSTMGEHLPTNLHILAIDSELDKIFGGSGTSLTEAELLAEQSGISTGECTPTTTESEGCLTTIEELHNYAHNDPAGATPEGNEFFAKLKPYLEDIAK